MKGEYMMELEKMLIEEGERYKRVEMAVRSLAPKRCLKTEYSDERRNRRACCSVPTILR